MISNYAPFVSPRTHRAGFTLTEIVLALAVIAIAFVGVLGLLPAGLDASRQAADSTVVAEILEDLHNRLQGQQLKTGAVGFSPAFYDDHGNFLDTPKNTANPSRLYRAEVKISSWQAASSNKQGSAALKPANTGVSLRPITISLYWPVDANGTPLGKKNANNQVEPKTVVTYCATSLAGSDWAVIDTSYIPKIEY